MQATRPFMASSAVRDWWHLLSTFAVMAGFLLLAWHLPWWPARLAASCGLALTMTRAFILFHDLHHLAMFQGSRAGRLLLNLYGLVLLTPPRTWRSTHNHHHAHTARTDGAQHGAYTLYSTARWRLASWGERLAYRIEHHPLTLLLGYLTVFLFSFGVKPWLLAPIRGFDSGAALLVHGALGVGVYVLGGPAALWFVFLVPFLLAGAIGAFLFYIQHYYEGAAIPEPRTWTHPGAALGASSYLRLGAILRWFTGNIGYHHVHHLNPRIPFYRLPQAMAAIPELQQPVTLELRPRTMFAALRLKLWDAERGRLVGYRDARPPRTTRRRSRDGSRAGPGGRHVA